MVAHRPGFIAPTMAARMFATLDRLSGGRRAAHIITASSDLETQGDGDFLTKAERYRRSAEYVGILRAIWSSAAPVDHAADVYRFEGASCDARPLGGVLPVWWGGASDLGVACGAQCADVYAMGGGTVAGTSALIADVRSAARACGRSPTLLVWSNLSSTSAAPTASSVATRARPRAGPSRLPEPRSTATTRACGTG